MGLLSHVGGLGGSHNLPFTEVFVHVTDIISGTEGIIRIPCVNVVYLATVLVRG